MDKTKIGIFLRTNTFLYIVIASLILVFYWKAFGGYFQSDEWFYFINFLPLTREPFGIFHALYKSIFDSNLISGGGHLTPIYNVIWFLHNQFFGITYVPYILLSLVVHITNSLLVFIFVNKLTQQRFVSFISSLFFAVSFVHFQAITWIMAYVPTEYSVLFLLLSLISLYNSFSDINKGKAKKNIRLSYLFFVLALLTKESTVILFFIFPLIFSLEKKRITDFRRLIKYYIITTVFYFPYRFLLPLVIAFYQNNNSNIQSSALDPMQTLFRFFTYPLKVITEIFIPGNILLSWVENLTPLAYPNYALQKAVRGTDYLTFTQGAGSDILIYFLGACLLISSIILCVWMRNQNRLLGNAVLLGICFIILSAWPLLLISTYAPWWGYTSYIDSRHLYLSSIGGSLVFSLALYSLKNFFSMIHWLKRKYSFEIIVTLIIITWSILQYTFLQEQLSKEALTGTQRKTIIHEATRAMRLTNPQNTILVQSNTTYYGFGLIPPFQTNLGQILSVVYYANHLLPEEFMYDSFLTKGGLMGQGYKEINRKGFGYYNNSNDLLQSIAWKKVDLQNYYSLIWDGKLNTAVDKSDDFRRKIETMQKKEAEYADWKRVTLLQNKLTFHIPKDDTLSVNKPSQDTILSSADITSGQDSISITIYKKTYNVGIYEDISFYANSDGEKIGDNHRNRIFTMLNDEQVVARIPTRGTYVSYFVPTIANNIIIELTDNNTQNGPDNTSDKIEKIIASMQYQQ